MGTHHVQILRSATRWSSGIFTESSILSAYLSLIEESQHYIYIENQFFVTSSIPTAGLVSNKIGLALYTRIKAAHEANERFHVYVGLTRGERFVLIKSASVLTTEVWMCDAATPQASFSVVTPRRQGRQAASTVT